MKLKGLSVIIVLLSLPALLQADDKWVGGGGDDKWITAANWDLGRAPISGERAYVDVGGASVLIDTGETGICTKLIGPCDGVQSTQTLTVKGALSNSNYWYFGRAPGGEGIVNIDGGTVTCRELYLGYTGGTGTLNITNGGTFTLSGTSTVGLIVPGDSSSTGTVNISDGTITAAFLSMLDYGLIDIGTNGLVKVKNDVRTTINGYISSGYITAEGGSASVVVLYDGTYTTLQSSNNPLLSKANSPSPLSGATGVSTIGTVLSWTAGVTATSHNVYFGTDSNNLTLVSSEQAGTAYDPGYLDYTTTYYWRIDEVTSGGAITGDMWNFRTKGSITVEYFENYADNNSLKTTWKDGTSDSSSGSSIALSTVYREGTYSCEFSYDNTGAVGGKYYSEIERTPSFSNFLINNAKSMDIWYKGASGNSVQKMYIALSDGTNTGSVDVNSVASEYSSVWIVKHVDLADFTAANPSLDMSNLTKMYIGIGDKTATSSGGTGLVYIDYIGLWPSRCLTTYSSDLNDDCKVDFADFAIMASDWLGNGMWPLW